MDAKPNPAKGRGSVANPANRFERLHLEPDPDSDADPAEHGTPRTEFLTDLSQSVISHNDSPDIPFRSSLNPYRGCEHGCAYCYARPTHEYLGFSAGLDFESRILVKPNAAELLRRELGSARWEPQWLALSGVTDPYQPVERRLRITRACLEVLAECRSPVGIVTKNHLVTRDIDLLRSLTQHQAAVVHLSITTLDPELARALEPRASLPAMRLQAVAELARAGIPVGVLVAPVIPGLNDHEIPAILEAAARAGAGWAGRVVLRLPHGVAPLFAAWLDRHHPLKKQKILSQVQAMRGGRMNDSRFGSRMRGEGPIAEGIATLFTVARKRAGLAGSGPELSTAAFRRPSGPQMQLEL